MSETGSSSSGFGNFLSTLGEGLKNGDMKSWGMLGGGIAAVVAFFYLLQSTFEALWEDIKGFVPVVLGLLAIAGGIFAFQNWDKIKGVFSGDDRDDPDPQRTVSEPSPKISPENIAAGTRLDQVKLGEGHEIDSAMGQALSQINIDGEPLLRDVQGTPEYFSDDEFTVPFNKMTAQQKVKVKGALGYTMS